jgi:hypothetical protein
VDLIEIMHRGFEDELSKIAGWSRAGRRPLRAATLLAKRATMTKVSGYGDSNTRKLLTAAGVGGVTALVGVHKGKKAIDDYRLGRAMRKQQQG